MRSLTLAGKAFAMKLRIDRVRVKEADRPLIPLVVCAPAQCTRPMARRKCKGFVVKEQRCPAAGHPLRRDPPFELKRARDPTFGGPGANDLMPAMDAAAVSQPATAERGSDDFSVRRDAVSLGHLTTIMKLTDNQGNDMVDRV